MSLAAAATEAATPSGVAVTSGLLLTSALAILNGDALAAPDSSSYSVAELRFERCRYLQCFGFVFLLHLATRSVVALGRVMLISLPSCVFLQSNVLVFGFRKINALFTYYQWQLYILIRVTSFQIKNKLTKWLGIFNLKLNL